MPSATGGTFTVILGKIAAGQHSVELVDADPLGNGTLALAAPGAPIFTISHATTIVTWSAPRRIDYGTALCSSQLNATANVPGTFSYTPAAGTILAVGTDTLTVNFTPTDTIDFPNASATVSIICRDALRCFIPVPGQLARRGTGKGPMARRATISSATRPASPATRLSRRRASRVSPGQRARPTLAPSRCGRHQPRRNLLVSHELFQLHRGCEPDRRPAARTGTVHRRLGWLVAQRPGPAHQRGDRRGAYHPDDLVIP